MRERTTGKGTGYAALFITSIVWGTTWVASKIGVAAMPALQMAAIRQFLAGACFVAFYMIYKKAPLPSSRQFRWIIIMAILMFVCANGLSTWSLKYIPTGLSALIGALYPLSVVLIEKMFFRGRRLTWQTYVGLLLGIVGIGIVFYEHAFHHLNGMFLVGVVLSLLAMLSWSLGTVFLARNKENIDPYYGTGWQMLLSSAMLFIISSLSQPSVPLVEIPAIAWGVILYLVVFGSVLSFAAFIYSLDKLPTGIASLYAYINPLVAMVVAGVFLDEILSLNILWGSLVTLAGVFMVNYSMHRERKKLITESEI